MPDEKVLRAKAREVVLAGKPDAPTARGPGRGSITRARYVEHVSSRIRLSSRFSSPTTALRLELSSSIFTSAASRRGSSSATGMSARTASPMEQESLRLFIRRKIQNGRLPHAGIRRIWSSPSDGQTCDACDATLAKEQLLMEGITLGLGRRRFQFHVRCFQIWDHERRAA